MSEETIVLKGKLFNKSFTLAEGQEVVVGRGEKADIQIFEGELSRRHCAFRRRKEVVYLRDLNSSNGTCVNGKRIKKSNLQDGDVIGLGDLRFTFTTVREGRRPSTTSVSAGFVNRSSGAWQMQVNVLYGAVRALVAAIEAKDEYTRGHSERVTEYALTMARHFDLKDDRINTLELAGFLHDIGKIAVPESILHKPGRLTDEEFEVIKQHPRTGHDILRQMEGTEALAEVVLHHHERWDGKGYPEGLTGSDIPLLSRLLAVADTFDAMGSKRPYRDRIVQSAVLDEIKRNAGSQFDPEVAEALLKEAEAGRIYVEADHARQPTFESPTVRLP